MKVDEKQEVIEVLLCSVLNDTNSRQTTWETCRKLGIDDRGATAVSANALWGQTRRDGHVGHAHPVICLEAAYRLIESSPRLRKEWFGR